MATKPPPHVDANDIALSHEKRKKNRHLPLDALDALAAVAVHAQNVANAEQPTCFFTIKSGHGENTLTSCMSDPDGCTLCQTASHNPPNPPETPGPVLGQVCIDHIDSMLGVRTETQTDEMRACVELTDRVVNLANNLLEQQKDLLATLRHVADEVCESDESSIDLEGETNSDCSDDAGGDGDAEGDDAAADVVESRNGRVAVNKGTAAKV